MAKNPNKVSVWQSLRNAWKVPDIRKKILYTFFMLLIFRLVSAIPAPGVDWATVNSQTKSYAALDLLNAMTGGSLSQMTIMAMGVTPYINSSIIMQLLTIAIPALEKLSKSGPDGQKKITRITRYVTVVLAALQAWGIVAALSYADGTWNKILVAVSMAGGTALAMWIGERITEKGIGNGISLLIFIGIISNLFNGFRTYLSNALSSPQISYDSSYNLVSGSFDPYTGTQISNGAWGAWAQFLVLVIIAIVIIVVVTYVDMAVRRINVNYAKRVSGRKMFGGQNSIIPLKLVSVGVLPLIFAYSFMSFPSTIITIVGGNGGFATWWNENMTSSGWLYMVVVALLIVAFTYFYSSISFNPEDMAKNIQQQGGMIPNVRPGKPTEQYLARVNSRLTLFAALFLAVLSIVPTLATNLANINLPFAASSILISVSIVLETKRQLDDLLAARNYETLS